jgi:methylmalonyl-CoA mutase
MKMKNKEPDSNIGYDENGKLFGEFKAPSYEEWQEAVTKLLKGKPFEKAMFTKTPEGITLNPIYNKEALEALPYVESLPGFFPYLRGTKVEGNLNRPWDICQAVTGGLPSKFNKNLEEALYKGQTAIKMPLDLPTQFGEDADQSTTGLVGQKGVSISTLDDLITAFQDLVIDILPLNINVGMHPVPFMALLTAYTEVTSKDLKAIQGVVGYDPLGMLAKHGQLQTSLEEVYDAMSDVLEFVQHEKSAVRTILIEGHPYHNGGADAVQELSYAMATATEYIRAMLARGHDIEIIAKSMAFSFSLGSNFFMELSKIRAARVTFAKIIRAFGGSDEAAKIYIHGKTSSWTKTVYDPYVNMLRNASEAFSGAVAGVDSLDVVAFDEPIRESDDFSRRVSRNVQSILQDECRFTQPIDPAGGSWYIESLTHEIAEKAWGSFQAIEGEGGMYALLDSGKIKTLVADKYEDKFKNMAKRKHVWVGTNMYANMTEEKIDAHTVDYHKISKERKSNVETYRMKQDLFDVENVLSDLGDHKLKTGKIHLRKAVIAAKHGATLGDLFEVCVRSQAKAVAKGEVIKFERGAERFETLRDKTLALKAAGKCPRVFLFNYGKIPKHKGRADFSTGFFEVGAFEVLKNNGFMDVDSAVQAGLDSGAEIGVVCSTDDIYPEIVPLLAKAVKEKSNMTLVLAGRPPKDLEEVYRQAGIDHFIYMGADCYGLLSKLQGEVE